MPLSREELQGQLKAIFTVRETIESMSKSEKRDFTDLINGFIELETDIRIQLYLKRKGVDDRPKNVDLFAITRCFACKVLSTIEELCKELKLQNLLKLFKKWHDS